MANMVIENGYNSFYVGTSGDENRVIKLSKETLLPEY